jgi:hypothetical protein
MNFKIILDVGITLGVLGIATSFFLFHSELNKNMKFLVAREFGILTHEQAIALMELYLTLIQTALHPRTEKFFEQEVIPAVENGDKTILHRFIYRDANEIIGNVRNRVAIFKITGGQSYKAFLDVVSPLDGGPIQRAREQFEAFITEKGFVKGDELDISKENIEQLKSKFLSIIEETDILARRNIENELEKRYKR